MTLRLRWTISILAILGLFGLNLAVYVWGNARRDALIDGLKLALERKDLAVEVANRVDDQQRRAEVMEPLVFSGAVAIGESDLEDLRRRSSELAVDITRLEALGNRTSASDATAGFERLAGDWLAVYQGREAEGYARRARGLSALLEEREATAADDADRAEEEFQAVARLTDRVTLAIFAASSVLAAAIALWFSTFLRRAFARYVTAEVAANVLETRSGLELGGEKREITVLMADLRGFSGLAERLPAEQVVGVINNFLGVMTEIIVSDGGTIDEFIGDAILVFFGAPVGRDDHAEAAVACALRMQLGMDEVNRRNVTDGLPEVEMGIGIHSGEVVVGNIGSETRTKYGAVGATVNLAGRIEANTVGGQILISAATRDQVAADLRVDRRLEIRPKGFDELVELFEVSGMESLGLAIPRPAAEMTRLERPLAVRFSILEGKETSGTRFDAELLAVSKREAKVRSRVAVPPLTDLKIEIGGPADAERPVATYAKAVEVSESIPDTFVVRFTSSPDELLAAIESDDPQGLG